MNTRKNYRDVTHAFLDVAGQAYEIEGSPAILLLLLSDRPEGITRLEMLQLAPPSVALHSSDHVGHLRERGIEIQTIRSSMGPDHLRYRLSRPVIIRGGVLIRDYGRLRLERLGAKSSRPYGLLADISPRPSTLSGR